MCRQYWIKVSLSILKGSRRSFVYSNSSSKNCIFWLIKAVWIFSLSFLSWRASIVEACWYPAQSVYKDYHHLVPYNLAIYAHMKCFPTYNHQFMINLNGTAIIIQMSDILCMLFVANTSISRYCLLL